MSWQTHQQSLDSLTEIRIQQLKVAFAESNLLFLSQRVQYEGHARRLLFFRSCQSKPLRLIAYDQISRRCAKTGPHSSSPPLSPSQHHPPSNRTQQTARVTSPDADLRPPNVSFPLSPREERGALRGPGMEQGVGRIVHTHTHAESQRLKQQCSYLTLSQESSSPSDSHLETALEQGNVRPHNLPSTHLHTSGRQEGQEGKVIKRHKQWKDK